MRFKSLGLLTAVAGLLLAAIPAMAHHSAAVQYDVGKQVKVTGTLIKVEWQNPHNWYYVDVKDDKGVVTHWAAEAILTAGIRAAPARSGQPATRRTAR